MDTTIRNEFEGIEFIPLTKRFAAYANKWPPFPKQNLIGTYGSLVDAVEARKSAINARPVNE